ncbi:YiiD C-terminal domain-containing protein [Antrihabitans sp. YC2-6]|uniref:YiiD C-terminal domain-containing protein n=1 Tax=Antrihabitans sp. YC2-6 TaxID=2799498 RepID=UPI0018F60862|nr:YiiD C-terminal domain-containing protein [Antrihabitans sp. YC2-6]MBJ8348498.1 YiiD C-terminal domain-containing protein [Antrihabitans sp. YC2-6]
MTDGDEQPPFTDIMNSALEFTIPAAHRMGVKALDVRRGFAATSVPIEGNGNHFGVMYAGVLFTVAELLGGAISIASFDNAEYYPLVKDIQITFKRPAKTDVTADASLSDDEITRITAEAAANGKCDFVLESVVTDSAGETVATTKGLYQLRAHGR